MGLLQRRTSPTRHRQLRGGIGGSKKEMIYFITTRALERPAFIDANNLKVFIQSDLKVALEKIVYIGRDNKEAE